MRGFWLGYALLVLFALAGTAQAKDGDVLSRQVVTVDPDTEITQEEIFFESDDLRIQAFLAYPKSAVDTDRPLPCLVFNRGGNRQLGEWTQSSFAPLGAALAGWGYVLLAVNYRGSGKSDGADEFGGEDVHDVVNALCVFDQLDFADGKRIGMWGFSRGGLMTLLALMETERVQAAICVSGFTDMFALIDRRPEMEELVLSEVVPNWEQNSEAELERRSPAQRIHDLPDNVPILLIHGTADNRGDALDTLAMATNLQKVNVPYRLVVFEGGDHALTRHHPESNAQARAWLDRYVRNQKVTPSCGNDR